ncbi:MAG: hypothetical protein ACREBU_00870 [Nitrososphaera sp.]
MRDSWWELLKTHHSFYKIGQERKQAVIKFYQCAVVDKKEMTHVGCIDLIKGVLQISRATVYNYLPDEYKRAYSSKQKSKVRHSHQVLFCARCDQQMREGDFNYLCDNCGNAVFM